MMIVSDFDGTIKRFDRLPSFKDKIDLNKDIKAIKKFIEEGNDFIISTYRKTPSIKEILKKYKVLYTYLTTYNGLITFNNKNELVFADYIDKSVLKDIINALKKYNIDNVTFYNENGVTNNINNIVMIGIKSLFVTNIFKELTNCDLDVFYNRNTFWLCNKTSKEKNIKQLLDSTLTKYTKEDIITIGDSSHDIDMIKEYNGYCIINSSLDRYGITNKKTKNIRSLIKTYK